jgi:hypothetical protein
MCEEGNVKYTKTRETTNKGPQDLVPPLSWVICLLGHGSFQKFPFISTFFGWFGVYSWQGFIIHDFLFPSFLHAVSCVFQIKVVPARGNVFLSAIPVPSSPTCETGYLVHIFCRLIMSTSSTDHPH